MCRLLLWEAQVSTLLTHAAQNRVHLEVNKDQQTRAINQWGTQLLCKAGLGIIYFSNGCPAGKPDS